MSNKEATARPWKFQPRHLIVGDVSGDEAVIVARVDTGETPEDRAIGRANAELIVTAVNERDALLAERDRLREALSYVAFTLENGGLSPAGEIRRLAGFARAALSGKEGEVNGE